MLQLQRFQEPQSGNGLSIKIGLDNGKIVDKQLFKQYLEEELLNVKNEVGIEKFENGRFDLAKSIFEEITLSENVEEFLTLRAYEEI